MTLFRIEISKKESLRYISHLDYANLLQRCIRRAKLPAAYSEGFNPHMKVSFASALALGVTTDAEYADIELTRDMCQPEFFDKLSSALPEGIQLLQAKKLNTEHPKSMNALADTAVYELVMPEDISSELIIDSISKFNAASSIIFTRQRRGKKAQKGRIVKKDIDIKNYVAAPLQYNDETHCLLLKLKVSPNGSIKPIEVLESIRNDHIADLDIFAVLINRQALLSQGQPLINISPR